MANLTLRACKYRDLDRVVALEKVSFPDSPYRKFDFISFLFFARKGFKLAWEYDSLVGYVIAMRRNEGEGLIQSMAVAPEFRRRGFGEALLMSAMNHLAVKYQRAYLLVDEKNESAIHLYHKVSFKETGNVVKRYYPNGDNAIEMMRELGDVQDSAANEMVWKVKPNYSTKILQRHPTTSSAERQTPAEAAGIHLGLTGIDGLG